MELNARQSSAAVNEKPIEAVDKFEAVKKIEAVEKPATQKVSLDQLRQQAIAAHNRGDWAAAIKGYQIYLQFKPATAAVWTNLGAALRKLKHYQSAVNCYRRALELAPDDLTAKGNLANALKDLHRLDEAIALHQEVTAAKPNDVQALMNYACALREQGDFETALEQLNRAQTLDPQNAGVEWERAQNLLYLGRYSEGWQAFEARWRTGELPVNHQQYPQWRGEDITGKHILLHSEQGYGDTILAARYVRLVKDRVGHAGTVTLQCKPELHRLFKSIGADQLIAPDQSPQQSVDLHCPLMSLMGCFNTQPDTIPPPAQLHIPDEARKKFAFLESHPSPRTLKGLNERGKDKGYPLKVGIVWSGSITFANNDNRAVSLKQFLPLAEIPNVRLYSLQKGPRLDELKDNYAQSFIQDIGSLCDDFADTAAAIEQLDVVVMTDSSVAHLAGSLNKPVINLLQNVPYWLYALDESRTPWYPSMSLLKQAQSRDWETVFQQAIKQLKTCEVQE